MDTQVTHVLYLIQAESGPVKIGVSNDFNRRLSQLQTSTHETLTVVYTLACSSMEQASQIERVLHQRYKHVHIRGEWFRADPKDIIANIELGIKFSEILTGFKFEAYPIAPAAIPVPAPRQPTGEAANAVTQLPNGSYQAVCPYCAKVFDGEHYRGVVNALATHIGRYCSARKQAIEQ